MALLRGVLRRRAEAEARVTHAHRARRAEGRHLELGSDPRPKSAADRSAMLPPWCRHRPNGRRQQKNAIRVGEPNIRHKTKPPAPVGWATLRMQTSRAANGFVLVLARSSSRAG